MVRIGSLLRRPRHQTTDPVEVPGISGEMVTWVAETWLRVLMDGAEPPAGFVYLLGGYSDEEIACVHARMHELDGRFPSAATTNWLPTPAPAGRSAEARA